MSQQWDSEFAAALQDATRPVPGLVCEPDAGLPRLFWQDDPRGAYTVQAGLVARSDGEPDVLHAWAVIHYLREREAGGTFERDEYALDAQDTGTRVPAVVAALVVAAVVHHHTVV
ncbi:hypothetical protein AB0A60_33755 [Streptomyces sp. NPDC046275]|uniref:hypothetical protein n=1 Tax=Streptomyces sp. NPDC046275 TaxID=3157201 RepID=UPI0033F415E5